MITGQKMKQEFELVQLNNGIRATHKQVKNTRIAHIGIMFNIGSRDELADEQGIAHFWEHMAFKGTAKKTAFKIIDTIESFGGEINAYTSKEKICFYASIMDDFLEKTIELLVDISFRSTFPAKHIKKEKDVVLEEINLYKDSPEDAIQDEFDEILFPGIALGKNILGTPKIVASFDPSHLNNFIQRELDTENIVFSSSGSYSATKFFKICKKYLNDIPHKKRATQRAWDNQYRPLNLVQKKHILQSHVALGSPSLSSRSDDYIPFIFIVNLLGGPQISSKLNIRLRENQGLVYAVDSHFIAYQDTGHFGIYFATAPKNTEQCLSIIHSEIEQLQAKPLSDAQLHKAKNQAKGQMAMAEENRVGAMMMMAKTQLDLNETPPLDMIFSKIDQITSSKIIEIAKKYLSISQMSYLTYKPQ